MMGVAAVSAGSAHTMILKTDGSLCACGYNNDGELGDGTTNSNSIPQRVMTGVAAVAAGYRHTMILKTDGSLWACGRNNCG
jgi:alpha-tubulin suppressor-like RCC1 family protein